jgi:hypothetical protein
VRTTSPARRPRFVSMIDGLLLSLVLGAAIVLLLFSLPRTAAPYALAARALGTFEHVTVVASVERLGRHPPLLVRCLPLPTEGDSITLNTGGRLIVNPSGRMSSPHAESLPRRGEIQLAGCRDLISITFAELIANV